MQANAERKKVALDERGIELNVLDWGGSGPLALLCHANGFCAAVWDLVARRLRERYRVIGYDARGHGDSSKPREPASYAWSEFSDDLIALAETQVQERNAESIGFVVGHSFGGSAAFHASAQRPDLFSHTAVLDPIFFPAEVLREQSPSSNRLAEGARKRRHVWKSRDEARARWCEREPFSLWDPRALELYLTEGFRDLPSGEVELKCPGEIEAMIYESNSPLDLFAAAKKLRSPTLLVRAIQGHLPAAVFRNLARSSERIQLVEMDADHLLPMVAPDAVASLLLNFNP